MKRYLLLIIYTCVCAIGPTWAEDRIDGLSTEPAKTVGVYSPAASAKPEENKHVTPPKSKKVLKAADTGLSNAKRATFFERVMRAIRYSAHIVTTRETKPYKPTVKRPLPLAKREKTPKGNLAVQLANGHANGLFDHTPVAAEQAAARSESGPTSAHWTMPMASAQTKHEVGGGAFIPASASRSAAPQQRGITALATSIAMYKPTISQAGMAVQPTAARFGAPIARGRGDGGVPIIDFPDDPNDEFLDYPEPLSDGLWILLLMAIVYGVFVRYFRNKDAIRTHVFPLFMGKNGKNT